MGVTYKLANRTQQLVYEPAMGVGNNKHGGFIYFAEEVVALLLGAWQGDDVVMVSDSNDEFCESWPLLDIKDAFLFSGDLKLSVEHNGLIKMLSRFVEAFGPETVAVALDAAMEQAAK